VDVMWVEWMIMDRWLACLLACLLCLLACLLALLILARTVSNDLLFGLD
jgi:lipopolysaccharide export LptBFGC system permease protein LptF